MTQQQLAESLERLHQQLDLLDKVDDETRAALARVSEDIQRLVDPDQPTTGDDVAESHSGVRALVFRFEAEHPQLADTLSRIADGLSKLGI